MNYKKFALFIAALVLMVVAVFFLSKDVLTPYVPFDEAMKSDGKYVQIIGALDKTAKVAHDEKSYRFVLVDKQGTSIAVRHADAKPFNFEHSEQIVALGKYTAAHKLFEADKVLLKCPSKYQKEQKP